MISYEKFIKLYPDEEEINGTSFQKDFPIGTKFIWCDRQKYTIVSYFVDTQFKNNKKDETIRFDHLVTFKTWSKYGQRWCYKTENTFEFYAVWEMMQREMKAEEKLKKKKK